jgi:hypothetical protein
MVLMKKQPVLFRQGDVLFRRCRTKLDLDKLQKRANGTVAYGEVTGHAHRLADLTIAEVLVSADGSIHVRAPQGATFVHEEHGPITLPVGEWDVVIQREYTPEEIRNVVD